MNADSDGVIREQWRAQPILGHAPVVATRAGPTVTTDDDLIEPSDEPGEAAAAAFEDEITERWYNEIVDEDGYASAWDIARALAILDIGIGQRLDAAATGTRARNAVQRRALARLRASLDTEREAHRAAAAEAATHIAALEARAAEDREALVTMRKMIASVELGAARDRSLRRLTEARRSYPHGDKIALETARRKTDAALEGQRQ